MCIAMWTKSFALLCLTSLSGFPLVGGRSSRVKHNFSGLTLTPSHDPTMTSSLRHHKVRHHHSHGEESIYNKISTANVSSNSRNINKTNTTFSSGGSTCPTDTTTRTTISERSDPELVTVIDQFVSEVFRCHHSTTALTLAVVRRGRTLFTKGYGRSKVRQDQPVTSRTRFAIASLTKAFTATVVVNWLYQHNLSLDTPIQSFYPEFRVTDDLRSRMATFRDLLAHRMGIPGHFKALLVGFPQGLSRAEFVKAMAAMPTRLSFRNKFLYNNYMYTVAAHVIERMSRDKTWEDLVRETLLEPLNMTGTGFFMEPDSKSYKKDGTGVHIPDFAHGCAVINGSLEDVPQDLWLSILPCSPAGAIYSSADDMAKWMTFLLSEGQSPNGSTLVDPRVLHMTWQPSMLLFSSNKDLQRPLSPVSHVTRGYGLGWQAASYRGFQHVHHTGGFITHSSRLWLFPDLDAGIFLNVNGPQSKKEKTNLINSVMYYLADELLGETHWFNISTACAGLPRYRRNSRDFSQGDKDLRSSHNASSTKLTADKSPSDSPTTTGNKSQNVCAGCPHIDSFVGTYSHECFGEISISLQDGDTSGTQLFYKFGRFGQSTVSRVSPLNFEGNFDGLLQIFNQPARNSETLIFSQNKTDDIDSVFYRLDDNGELIEFRRLPNDISHPRIQAVKTADDKTPNLSRDGSFSKHNDRAMSALAAGLMVLVSLIIR